ncbi:MAG: exopolysaccharide transport family protein [Proteobacteria bacterium]|nr:exopolysaccharide transport family protein [Pseudomonadota bacterium]
MDAARPASYTPYASDAGIESVAGALWRRKFWILIPTLIALVLSILVVNLMSVRYTGEARILLENRDTVYSRPDRDVRASDPAIDPEAVASQVQVVNSKDLALKVIREMALARREEFDPVQKGLGLKGALLVMFGLQPDPRTIPQEERVLEVYYKRLLVYPLGKSRVIAIEFQSEDPKLAADVANRIAEEYLSREEGAKNQTSRATSEWLDKAIDPLMKKVLAAEGRVEAFRASKGLFVGANNTSISSQQLSELNTQLSLARSQQADLQARAKLIREALRLGKVFETSEINNNELVRRLLEQRAQFKAQIALEERNLLPQHPRMKELQSQLADLEGQIRAAAERAARAFENDARTAGARVASMQAELDSQKKATALSNEDEVQLRVLEREAAALREQLNSYRNKFLDAAARSGESAQPADGRIISRAFPQSEPTYPKKLPIVLLATLATFVLCCALVATQALMRMGRAEYPLPLDPAFEAHATADHPAQGEEIRAASRQDFQPTPEAPSLLRPARWWEKAARRLGLASAPEALPQATWSAGFSAEPTAIATSSSHMSLPLPSRNRAAQDSAADELARQLARLDFHDGGKVVAVLAAGPEVQSALTTLRFARRLAADGAAMVIDLCGSGQSGLGRSNLYTRVIARVAGRERCAGLCDYLDRVAALGDIIHRDQRSGLHIVPAGGSATQRMASGPVRQDIARLIDALSRSYTHVLIDAGPLGGAGEFVAEKADAIILLANARSDDDLLVEAAARLEALRDAPVFVMSEESGSEFAAANDAAPMGQVQNA